MKILTRISVVLLLAAGVYFLREANIDKAQNSETNVSQKQEKNNKKNPLELEFKEESQEKVKRQEALKNRIEALREKSHKNNVSVAVNKIAAAKTVSASNDVQPELLTEKQIEKEVEQIMKESKITPIKIFLYEWELDISDRTIPEGKILFEVHNDGWFSHDFAIKGGENFGKVFPGEVAFFLTDHLEKGEYEVYSPKLVDQMHNIAENFIVE